MKTKAVIISILGSIVIISGLWLVSRPNEPIDKCTKIDYEPNITPDYCDIVIPYNIAPLNFRIKENGRNYHVKIHSSRGAVISITTKTGLVQIPLRQWRSLLNLNKGNKLIIDVYVKDENNEWHLFKPVINTIAKEEIDDTIVYRFMKPIYKWWKDIGIYQRNLTGYDVSQVLHGRSFGGGCLNCHSFIGNAPDTMTIALRSRAYGSYTIMAQNGKAKKIGTKWGYTAWHPSGRMAVYSINKVRQFFHTGGLEIRDVVDLDSALLCYHVDSDKVLAPPELSDKNRLETYPTWSPDGRYLYYCSGPVLWQNRNAIPPENYDKLKYDLRRISYDIETGQWGKAETVLAAEQTKLSILLPRISPDGQFLLFCMCRYGCFPIYQPSSDLYLMDLATGNYHKLNINSKYSESWHSWSSNSRWIAFSSKRHGGSLTRTYLSYIGETGQVHKSFIIPQKDPTYYDSLLETFSVPELVKGSIKTNKFLLAQAARSKPTQVLDIPITQATPQAKTFEPWQERE
jgi:hypothetical protein